MDRYSEITNKNQREIVLLKGFPCIWGKCSFCDYIDDNSNLEEEMNKLNLKVLKNVTGKYGVLEVINSGSCFELPKDTLEKIKCIIKEKNIKKLFLESHWSYKNRLKEMREYFEKATVNVFINNSSSIKRDEELVKWFVSKYKFLDENPNIEVLYNNTDFGVGD